MRSVTDIRRDFPILRETVHGRPLIYLDNAAAMQMPEPVLQTVTGLYHTANANVHRGVHELSRRSTAALEAARETVRAFLNAENTRQIVFTSGTTGAVNLVAHGLPLHAGDEVLVSEMEHHSNLVPWQEACRRSGAVLKIIPVTEAGELDIDAFAGLLTPRTGLVAVTMVSNVLGTVNPVQQICRAAHTVGARVLVDGAQGMKLGRTDVQAMDCDYLAFSGHKLGALTGIGVLYGRADALQALHPACFGGGMVDTVGLYDTAYGDLPGRLEAGTPNYVGAVSLGAALNYLSGLGLTELAAYEDSMLALTECELKKIPGIRILGSPARRAGAISFTASGTHPFDLGALMDAQGVAVRTGHHCAQPILRRYGLESAVRISPAFYNTGTEILQAVQAVKRAISVLKEATS